VEGCLAHDTLALAALHIHLCPPTTTLPLSCCLVMEFVPGSSLFRSPAAFAPGCLAATAADLGRLFTLDMLLGNPDRLRCEELAWRGNTGGLWLFFERGGGGGGARWVLVGGGYLARDWDGVRMQRKRCLWARELFGHAARHRQQGQGPALLRAWAAACTASLP
jgi:hypothetical protein